MERSAHLASSYPPLLTMRWNLVIWPSRLASRLLLFVNRPVSVFPFCIYFFLFFHLLTIQHVHHWEAFQEAAVDVHGLPMLRAAIMILCRSVVLLLAYTGILHQPPLRVFGSAVLRRATCKRRRGGSV